MFSQQTKKKKAPTDTKKRKHVDTDNASLTKTLPSFIKHYKHKVDGEDVNYKVGDVKTYNNEKWYFCDCPNHRDRIKWHSHTADDCRTRSRWLKQKKVKAEANLAEDEPTEDETGPSDISDENEDSTSTGTANLSTGDNVEALLATCMNLTQDNPSVRDAIVHALSQLSTIP